MATWNGEDYVPDDDDDDDDDTSLFPTSDCFPSENLFCIHPSI